MNSTSSKILKSDTGISVSGDLVFSNVADLLKEGNSLLKQHLANGKDDLPFTIDCKEMTRIDSAGIALLLEWQRQFKNKNQNCLFQGLSSQAQALIEAYRLQALISA